MISSDDLLQAGFLRAEWVPSDSRYVAGQLYVLMRLQGSLRVYLPTEGNRIEVFSGDLYSPTFHYIGPRPESVDELLERAAQEPL
ncbi:hypothetical protein Q5H93_08750 [Hymenobacter sp. ASUV-10]|uniref:Uncharacterized protein n=1 Tax=Hymenobacter aranciens TaxID=3063996 RepID=A0ABT9B976_9BACT|nr:hypothetical protein [Hymenobacter sp. ASUV-10]MDO7874816.1 hypothetical protein [Hymenobacter sp. ASUV-10]